jgi:nucleoside-diphosphate-sugar epimerase
MAANFRTILSMKAFVTGGTGFIGSHLVESLLHKNYEVLALVRDPYNLKCLEGIKVNILEGDLHSIPSLPSDLNIVYHVAGLTRASNKADYYTVNQQGTASLFQSLHSQKIQPKKIICLSSIAASSPSSNGVPIKETQAPRPVTPYGKSKLMGELEALKFKDAFPVVILRAAAVFGSKDQDWLNYYKFMKRGILPSLASSQRLLSLCYIKDLIRAFDLCSQLEFPSGEIFNIADPQPYLWDEFGRAVGKAIGKKLKKIVVPPFVLFIAAFSSEIIGKMRKNPNIFNREKLKDMMQSGWIADVQKAEETFSFRAQYPLEKAVKETLDWYIEHGWL